MLVRVAPSKGPCDTTASGLSDYGDGRRKVQSWLQHQRAVAAPRRKYLGNSDVLVCIQERFPQDLDRHR